MGIVWIVFCKGGQRWWLRGIVCTREYHNEESFDIIFFAVVLVADCTVTTNIVIVDIIQYYERATTVLVLTLGSGVHGFTLDPDKQTFLQTHPNMRIPDVGALYSFNEANSREYSEPVQQYLEKLKESGNIG